MDCRFVFEDGEAFGAPSVSGETLLATAERAGASLLVDCREGTCMSCRGRLTAGKVDYAPRYQRTVQIAPLAADEVLCCIAQPAQPQVEITFSYPRAAVRPVRPMVLELQEIVPQSEKVVLVRGAIRGRFKLAFMPGQYLDISIPGTDSRRSYSMANASSTPNAVELHVRLVPDGVMSEYLTNRARPGDLLDVRGPLGVFYLRRRPVPRVFVSGGTGLAPMVAMLRDLVAWGELDQPVSLLHGVTTRGDLYGIDEVKQLLTHFADARFAVAMVEADAAWDGVQGFVTDLPLAAEFERLGTDIDVYLCGPPPMIQAVRHVSDRAGIPSRRVFSEAFSAAPASANSK
ncbi:MAG: 2Fe-2S iron-sulfur cluster binding domain-containing protein [Burkholderiales bacterium]|nr:2Fe-2S iron-sulfur cluster binding domain-containing protein [Burkholderiales bacterium]